VIQDIRALGVKNEYRRLAEASEEGQGSQRTVKPMMMMMMISCVN
jgi:hypothetical protein